MLQSGIPLIYHIFVVNFWKTHEKAEAPSVTDFIIILFDPNFYGCRF